MKFDLGLARSERAPEPLSRRRRIFGMAVVTSALIVIWLLVYGNFIFGSKTLLYKDIGSDSITISFPYYVLLSDYLRNVGIPSWSFRVGMGHNLFPHIGTVLVSPVVWLAKGLIAKALVYQHLIYLLISGVLFARFLSMRGLTFAASLLGALLLSFSAYMCMGSCWYFHATEVVCFTLLLFAAEEAVGRGRWPYLVFAVAVVGFFSVFHLYLAALFLCIYVPVRAIERHSWKVRPILRTSLLLAGAAFLGVGLTTIVSIGSFYSLLNSPRGSGPTSLAGALSSAPIFGLESPLHYITAVLRPYANDMLGTGSDYCGWQNYLEAPMTYCGLISLVLFPQVFVGTARRTRVLYALLLGALLVATVFPWFRYLFWGFQGDYYRTFSLFWIFGIITLAMTVFSRYIEGHALNLWLLALTVFVLLGVLYLPLHQLQTLINPTLRLAATIFIVSYAALLIAGQLLKRQRMFMWLIVGLAAIELAYFDQITVSRPTVTKQELTERVGYNDKTVDAVRDINASDQSFFRITKTWGSGLGMYQSLNEAMVFGYDGTASYSSFNNLDYIKFLMAVDAISGDVQTFTHWSTGLIGHPLLSTFACEKYVIANDPVPYQMTDPYEFMKRYNNVYVFRNRLFLPLGLTFSRYLPEQVFLQLPSSVKPGALLCAVVFLDRNIAEKQGLSELTLDELKQQLNESSPADTIALRRATALNMRSFRETQIDGSVRVDAKSILVLQTPFDPGWRALVDDRAAPVLKVDVGLLGVVLDSGEHAVKLRYVPPFLGVGAAIALGSLAILALFMWKWPRLRSVA
jgi:hypothetical protein